MPCAWNRVAAHFLVAAGVWTSIVSSAAEAAPPAIDFNRDIRPLLSTNCYFCHGPDEKHRKADLRLDQRAAAVDESMVIVPGEPDDSEFIARITSDDPETVMPPPDSHKQLKPEQIALLRRWVAEGAVWQEPWAYVAPKKHPAPAVKRADWPRNWIDAFVLARLESEGLAPTAEADRVTLVRRLYFDVLGLPPTPEEVEAFVQDQRPEAYEELVDRLLANRHFGERMAMWWLDLVRFADTVGYHGDQTHRAAAYRDWVIWAFNQNLPFDRFTEAQIAGDILSAEAKGAGKSEAEVQNLLLASCYNRLLQTTHEGGAQLKEYRAIYQADRVRNLSQVFMGATVGCAQCHNHKYDPYTTRDFYSLGAFFADIDDEEHLRKQYTGGLNELPTRRLPEADLLTPFDRARAAALDAKIAAVQAEIDALPSEHVAKPRWDLLKVTKTTAQNGAELTLQPDGAILVGGPNSPTEVYTLVAETKLPQLTALRLEALPISQGRGPGRADNGNLVLTNFVVQVVRGETKIPLKLTAATADFEQPNFPIAHAIDKQPQSGWAIMSPNINQPRQADFLLEQAFTFQPGDRLEVRLEHLSQFGKHALGNFRLSASDAAAEVVHRPPTPLELKLKDLRARRARIVPQRVMVSSSSTPREVRILPRGNWLDETGEVVQPAVPAFLPPLAVGERRATRLDLARWLVQSSEQGGVGRLNARVQANRFWQLLMGVGLSRVLDDFGGQGEPPTHPELLDNLAVEFFDSGWNVKHLVKQIVMSNTYRQSSRCTPELRRRDPDNRLFARQARPRLQAEMIRDLTLAVSGLLVRDLGGPSVHPYQPPGYYAHLNFPVREYQSDNDARQWRRGVYVHWQRQFLHPMLKAFDAPTREECTAQRPLSNTPTAALVLLNDPTFVEAARVFAVRTLNEGGSNDEDRLIWAFRQITSRAPSSAEQQVLDQLLQKHRAQFAADAQAPLQIQKIGLTPPPAQIAPAELAAWTSVARALLNLNEAITRN